MGGVQAELERERGRLRSYPLTDSPSGKLMHATLLALKRTYEVRG